MKTIVTGGLGYLGSMLVKSLAEEGRQVIVLDKGIFGSEHKLPNVSYFRKFADFIMFCKGQLIDKDTICHLGGLSNDPMSNYDKLANVKINTDFTRLLIKALSNMNWKGKFIYASSASVYGFNSELVDEESKVDPNSAYAESKHNSELLLAEECEKASITLVILRKATVMGWSVRPRLDLVVNTMVASAYKTGMIKLFSGGEIWRPLVHIGDVVDCYRYFSADISLPNVSIWNLVHKNYRISELGLYIKKLIKDKYGKNIDIDSDYKIKDSRSYKMDGSKLEAHGFKTQHGVQKAVGEIWDGLVSGAIKDDVLNYNIKWIHNCEAVCKALGREFELMEIMS